MHIFLRFSKIRIIDWYNYRYYSQLRLKSKNSMGVVESYIPYLLHYNVLNPFFRVACLRLYQFRANSVQILVSIFIVLKLGRVGVREHRRQFLSSTEVARF